MNLNRASLLSLPGFASPTLLLLLAFIIIMSLLVLFLLDEYFVAHFFTNYTEYYDY